MTLTMLNPSKICYIFLWNEEFWKSLKNYKWRSVFSHSRKKLKLIYNHCVYRPFFRYNIGCMLNIIKKIHTTSLYSFLLNTGRKSALFAVICSTNKWVTAGASWRHGRMMWLVDQTHLSTIRQSNNNHFSEICVFIRQPVRIQLCL